LLAYQRGDRAPGTGAWSSRGRWPVWTGRPTDDAFGRQPVEQRGRVYSEEARYRDATLGDDNFIAFLRPRQPAAEVGTKLADGDVHMTNRTGCADSDVREGVAKGDSEPCEGVPARQGLDDGDPPSRPGRVE
jgi:hypothetical protein